VKISQLVDRAVSIFTAPMLSVAVALMTAPSLLHAQLPALVQASAAAPSPTSTSASGQQGPGVQSARDAREPQVLATCKQLAPPATFTRPPGFKPPSGEAHEYTVSAIKGVIAAGARWNTVWSVDGNNADGIVWTKDGLLIAQNSNSAVIQLGANGKATTLFKDTNTGGALSINKIGTLFIVQRGLYPSIWQLRPQRKLFADKFRGDPLDCLRTVINDLTADSHGGVYFTDGGLFYADSKGAITQYGENLTTNGIILSPDEKTLYVTNGPSVAAFSVQSDGSLTNQHEFARLHGSGDGSAVDSAGRVYVTANGERDGIEVFSPMGEPLGAIPTPYPVISLAFGGPGKKTLYAVAETGKSPAQAAAIITIPMTTSGYAGRAK
jgi:gluconolactonase